MIIFVFLDKMIEMYRNYIYYSNRPMNHHFENGVNKLKGLNWCQNRKLKITYTNFWSYQTCLKSNIHKYVILIILKYEKYKI